MSLEAAITKATYDCVLALGDICKDAVFSSVGEQTYDPATGTVTANNTDHPCKAVRYNQGHWGTPRPYVQDVQNTTSLKSVVMVIIPRYLQTFTAKPQDLIAIASTGDNLCVEKIDAQTTFAAWVLQCSEVK